ncbi:MAG: hypothetical protein LBS90_06665 [Oscillospiraceae bacterium]|nr:hypothetical protein [Oscillospiraceae bacterium]
MKGSKFSVFGITVAKTEPAADENGEFSPVKTSVDVDVFKLVTGIIAVVSVIKLVLSVLRLIKSLRTESCACGE